MKLDSARAISAGLGLIGFGIVLILANWLGWDGIWPIFLILGGLAAFAGYALGGFREGGLAFVGTAALLVGVFFFGFTLGYWDWAYMDRLWPVFVLVGGVSFVTLFFAERGESRDLGVLGLGVAAMIAGLAGLAYTHGRLGADIVEYWPLLLVLLGVFSLIGALAQGLRRG